LNTPNDDLTSSPLITPEWQTTLVSRLSDREKRARLITVHMTIKNKSLEAALRLGALQFSILIRSSQTTTTRASIDLRANEEIESDYDQECCCSNSQNSNL